MVDSSELKNDEINPVVVADDPDAFASPLPAGQGLLRATDAMVEKYVQMSQIQPILSRWSDRDPELQAVSPRGRVQPPKLRAFLDVLLERLPRAGSTLAATQ